MKMSKQLVSAYLTILEKIKEQKKIMMEMKEEEKRLQSELKNYLNQSEDVGIRVDDHTVITLTQNDKKINKSRKLYKEYLTELCNSRGLPDDEFVAAIMNGKVDSTVQQQKIKIIKIK